MNPEEMMNMEEMMMAGPVLGKPERADTAILIVDMQERLMPVIDQAESVITNVNLLIKGAEILDLPLLITEQYPQGLGHTDARVLQPEGTEVIEKISFSCMDAEGLYEKLEANNINTLIVAGIEAHICVLQTVLDLVEESFEVHVVADAISSRAPHNKELAIERMRSVGAFICSTEMILFQLLGKAGTEEFKQISKLVK